MATITLYATPPVEAPRWVAPRGWPRSAGSEHVHAYRELIGRLQPGYGLEIVRHPGESWKFVLRCLRAAATEQGKALKVVTRRHLPAPGRYLIACAKT